MFTSKDITVVFQGSVNTANMGTGATDSSDFLYNLATTRKALPEANFILSTWDNIEFPSHLNNAEKLGVDKIVYSKDPGAFPNIKFGSLPPNNANRQIVSTSAGINTVTTPYVLKMRTDSFMSSDSFIEHYTNACNTVQNSKKSPKEPYSPIIVGCYFTIDPTVYEHMAYHMSDWLQFAETSILQEYWNIPLVTLEDATYYERHPHRFNPNIHDRQFRTRLAVEQYITIQFAKKRGYKTPKWHNQNDRKMLSDFDKFLANHIIVLDLPQFGANFPKYAWASRSRFISMDCIMNADWYGNFVNYWQPKTIDKKIYALYEKRKRQKDISRLIEHTTRPIEKKWHDGKNKKVVNFLEKVISRLP